MQLINMTFSASLMILLTEIVRKLTEKRIRHRVFCFLWAAAAVRMLIPFSIPEGFGLSELTEVQTAAGGGASGEITMQGYIHYTLILKLIWAVGVLGFAVYFAITYLGNLYKFRESLPADGGVLDFWTERLHIRRRVTVRRSDFIRSPLTYGILRPVILMPEGTAGAAAGGELNYIYVHELIHIKRFDSLLKVFVTAAVCVNWFNPFAWVMYVLMNRDIELSCDEAVVCLLGRSSRAEYAMTLVRFAELRDTSLFVFNSFGKSILTQRVSVIMRDRGADAAGILMVLLLCLSVMAVLGVSSNINAAPAGAAGVSGTVASPADISIDTLLENTDEEVSANSDEVSDNNAAPTSRGSARRSASNGSAAGSGTGASGVSEVIDSAAPQEIVINTSPANTDVTSGADADDNAGGTVVYGSPPDLTDADDSDSNAE